MSTNPGTDSSGTRPPPVGGFAATEALSTPGGTSGGRPPAFVQLYPGAEPVPGYPLVEKLGAGGFGEVWKAQGPGGFFVAIKFLRLDEKTGSAEVRALDLMRDIRHANLLVQFGSYDLGSHLAIAMELADRTLFHRFIEAEEQGHHGIPGPELLDYMRDAARGLDHLHSLDIQHRDIKPQNFLLAGGSLKVADFGLAKIIDKNRASNSGSMTPAYAAPEFFKGHSSIHSDQYSLAISYCQLRGGKLPFSGTTTEMMYGHLENAPDLSMLPEVERPVVAKALAKKPEDRWPSCRDFVQALSRAMTTPDHTEMLPRQVVIAPPTVGPVTAPPPPGFPITPAPPRRSMAGPLMAGVAVLAVVVGVVAWALRPKPEKAAPDDKGVASAKVEPTRIEEPPKNEEPPKTIEPPKGNEKDGDKAKEKEKVKAKDKEKDKGKAVTTVPTPVAILKLAPLDKVSLKAGASAFLAVKIQRENLPGVVTLEVEGLPAGVKATPARLAAGEKEAKIELTAEPTAKASAGEVAVVVRGGDLRDTGKFRLEVMPAPIELVKSFSNSNGMKMVLIPAGTFMMGSPDGEVGRRKEEGPQHKVAITKPFYLGQYEMTIGHFRAFVEATGYATEAELAGSGGADGYNARTKGFEMSRKYSWKNTGFEQGDDYPVLNVSWNDAQAFCKWLSKKEGKKYNVPTEAEWEYACRAGTSEAFPGGNALNLVQFANIADADFKKQFPTLQTSSAHDGYIFTAPVGHFQPNAWGLYDMIGNAGEWCRDWYAEDAYQNSAANDPTGPVEGTRRVMRGGAWTNPPERCRPASRGKYTPVYRHPAIGFRVAMYPE